jgi:hypothetical protein
VFPHRPEGRGPHTANPMSERFLQVVHGDPTPEEIAALVAVLTARARAAAEATRPRPRPSAWSDPSRRLRRTLPHGPGVWRSDAWPR